MLVRGSNWALEGYDQATRPSALRVVLGWMSANLVASTLGARLGEDRYMRVRYEDLVEGPAAFLVEVARFCEFDGAGLARRVTSNDEFEIGHMVGGNRVRLQGKIKLEKRQPDKPGGGLLRREQVIFAGLARWLNRYYGYNGG
jgi:hypothetical protein